MCLITFLTGRYSTHIISAVVSNPKAADPGLILNVAIRRCVLEGTLVLLKESRDL